MTDSERAAEFFALGLSARRKKRRIQKRRRRYPLAKAWTVFCGVPIGSLVFMPRASFLVAPPSVGSANAAKLRAAEFRAAAGGFAYALRAEDFAPPRIAKSQMEQVP
jgi:hypothetical protein